jgi:[ribosomal protein S18]-alanine N-acetyltransferase
MAANPQAETAFRAMTAADLPAVIAIERACYEFPWTEGNFRDCLRAGYYCCLMTRGGDIAGYCILAIAAGEAHVLNLCIRNELQGLGLGRLLLEHLFGYARSARAGWMLLEVRKSNASALALYKGMGFVEIGLRRGYYPDKGQREDAIVLSCPVRPASGT